MEKTIAEQLTELKTGLETFSKAEIKTAIDGTDAKITALETKGAEVETLKTQLTELKEAATKNQKVIDAFVIEKKSFKGGNREEKSFNEILGEAIDKHKDDIQNMAPGQYSKSNPLRIPLLPEVKAEAGKQLEVKAVGDMTLAVNFPGASTMYQDTRNLIMTPYNRVYIADLLPQGTSTGTQITYPKENGGEGAVAAWTDYTANKAQVDFDITAVTSNFTWLAGWTVIQRDMLDDISWMTSYLQNRLLISLKTAENDFVLNAASIGLNAVASPYNGNMSAPVDRILDAAYGQIVDATSEWYTGNMAIVRSRDLVTKIGLNKASGSGEYDLPDGAVVFNADGSVSIGNLKVVGTTSLAYDTFFALDTRATTFVRRIQPELRIFEDATLAKKNQIMFRIEERATLLTFNNAAVVKGVLQLS